MQKAAQHPDDPLALYLAGVALIGKDSPTRVRLLEQAKAKGSQFPWPALELAFFYSGGKRVDKQKASENIAAFFHGCPDSADREAQRMLAKAGSTELQTSVATALRARLAKETSSRTPALRSPTLLPSGHSSEHPASRLPWDSTRSYRPPAPPASPRH